MDISNIKFFAPKPKMRSRRFDIGLDKDGEVYAAGDAFGRWASQELLFGSLWDGDSILIHGDYAFYPLHKIETAVRLIDTPKEVVTFCEVKANILKSLRQAPAKDWAIVKSIYGEAHVFDQRSTQSTKL